MEFDEEAFQAKIEIMLAMTPLERQLFIIQEDGVYHKDKMEQVKWQYGRFQEIIEGLKVKAKRLTRDYAEYNEDDTLEQLEEVADMIQTFTEHKSDLRREIKQEREKVQWLRKEWREAAEKAPKKNSTR